LAGIGDKLGLRTVTLGYRPFTSLADMPWMPKTRYKTMRQTLGSRGALATNMMLMTATGQVSLDWRSEEDCVRKAVASARISPLLVALYANSPLRESQPTGFLSYRSRVWNEVDPARCGYPMAMLDGSFSYRAYVEWALDAPLLFLRRRGDYQAPKVTFRHLLEHGYEGQPVTMSDWNDHLSTLFPEVRLKKILEIRAADCVNPAMTGALAALMRGLLYDETALDEATRLLPRMTPAKHLELHHVAQRDGLEAKFGPGTLADAAAELVEISRRGLLRLDPLDAPLLEPLRELAATGKSLARGVLNRFAQGHSPAAFLDAYEAR
jgi:glutamate--cysteine ligase